MKLSIFIISIIFISCQLSAQTNNKNQPSQENFSKRIKASDLKKKDLKKVQVTSKKKITTDKSFERTLEPKVKSKNKSILKPKQ